MQELKLIRSAMQIANLVPRRFYYYDGEDWQGPLTRIEIKNKGLRDDTVVWWPGICPDRTKHPRNCNHEKRTLTQIKGTNKSTMTQEQLRQEVLRFTDADDISTNIEYLDYFIQCYFDLVTNHDDDPLKSQAEADAKIILQMMFSKLIHLRRLFEGVSFINREGRQLINPIIDPTIVSSLVRNIFETVCMFNIIYEVPDTEDKRKILYNLWVVAGLNYRQRFSTIITTEANKRKSLEEKEKIENLKNEIESTQQYKDLDERNQGKIQTKLRENDYKIKIEGNTVRYLNWQEISEEFITNSDIFNRIYTYFSLYSHPSNVSVFQFADMFRKEDEAFKRIAVFNLRFCIALSSIFLSGIVKLFPNTISTFENRSEIEQIMLNFFNRMLRGDDKSISEVWKKLG